jgi:hypothetical protein
LLVARNWTRPFAEQDKQPPKAAMRVARNTAGTMLLRHLTLAFSSKIMSLKTSLQPKPLAPESP